MSTTPRKSDWARYVDRLVREHYGGVQSELARALDVSPGTVNRWSNQDVVPRHPVLRRLSEVTGRPMTELIAVAYEIDPDDAKLQAQAERMSGKLPPSRLDAVLDALDEAKAAKRITAKEHKSARDMITLAAEMQFFEKVTRKGIGDNSGVAAPKAIHS